MQDLLTKPDDATVARSVVALGHSLGLTAIAEGVETAEQRNMLAELEYLDKNGLYPPPIFIVLL